jgi:hypothetical protein
MDETQNSKVETVAKQLTSLSSDELEQLGEVISTDVITHLQNGTRHKKGKRSIMELQGLGKELWRAIDVDEYLKRERDSWR